MYRIQGGKNVLIRIRDEKIVESGIKYPGFFYQCVFFFFSSVYKGWR
jgi:hypothetical protein